MTKKHSKLILIFIMIVVGIWSCTLHSAKSEKTITNNIPLNTGVSNVYFLTDMEKEIVMELNVVRKDPKRYADFLKSLRGRPQWNQGLDETILFVEKKEPLPPFRISKGLFLAARHLLNDRGPEGLTGHIGKDGKSIFERMNTYGQWDGKAGEYLGYGYTEAEALVARMAIDEGSAVKDGQQYIFDRDFHIVGVACGPHKSYRIMCVIDFASSYRE
jgi:uncharacterized protein YkwD